MIDLFCVYETAKGQMMSGRTKHLFKIFRMEFCKEFRKQSSQIIASVPHLIDSMPPLLSRENKNPYSQ